MIESLILVQGKTVKKESLGISLKNAKQLIIGHSIGFGFVLHIAATTPADLSNALIDFAKITGVTEIVTLALRTP